MRLNLCTAADVCVITWWVHRYEEPFQTTQSFQFQSLRSELKAQWARTSAAPSWTLEVRLNWAIRWSLTGACSSTFSMDWWSWSRRHVGDTFEQMTSAHCLGLMDQIAFFTLLCCLNKYSVRSACEPTMEFQSLWLWVLRFSLKSSDVICLSESHRETFCAKLLRDEWKLHEQRVAFTDK